MTLKLSIPLRTGRGLNDRMHFMVRARKVKAERLAVGYELAELLPEWKELPDLLKEAMRNESSKDR